MTDFTKNRDIKLALEPISIDWELYMVRSIVGQILNNPEAKKNYVRILSIAMINIAETIKHEMEF